MALREGKRGALYSKSGRVYQKWTGAVDLSRSRRGRDEKKVSDTLEPGLLIKRNIRLMPRGLKRRFDSTQSGCKGIRSADRTEILVLCRAWWSLIPEPDCEWPGRGKGGALRADERGVVFKDSRHMRTRCAR